MRTKLYLDPMCDPDAGHAGERSFRDFFRLPLTKENRSQSADPVCGAYIHRQICYGPQEIGVNLIRDAFSQGKGPLTDATAPPGEQVSRMNLFWGAIGSCENPRSHRDVNLDDPVEALEIILLSNPLLRIVDTRAKESSSPSIGSNVAP